MIEYHCTDSTCIKYGYTYHSELMKYIGCVCDTWMLPAATKSKICYFKYKGLCQGHTVIDLGVIWKGFIRWVCIPNMKSLYLKAILQVLIYKALYDKSYLGSKTTMTSGEWTCLISFATAPLTCSERGGSEKFKMKIYVSSGIPTHTPPVHDRKVAAP